jgi:hypothetical protein
MVIALARYKAEHSAYPKTLDALVPEYSDGIEMDPFGNDALAYRREKDGFVLYSIGRDGVDNGGAPGKAAGPADGQSDTVWRRLK